jgi:hypothetical protein
MGKKAGWLDKVAYDPYAGQITEPNQIPNGQPNVNPMNDPTIKSLYDKVVDGKRSATKLREYCQQQGVNWQSDPYLLEALGQ